MLGHHAISEAPISALADRARTRAYVATGGIVYSGVAAISKTKAFLPSGGIVWAGDAFYQFVDVDTYVASGGIRYNGSAVTAFLPSAQPQPEAEQGHGIGTYLDLRSAGRPIAIRQYGDKVTFRYRASGGIQYGGQSDYRLVRFTVTHAARTSAAVIKFSGKARTRRYNEDEDFLALAA